MPRYDPDVIAALAEGRLDPEEAATVEREIAAMDGVAGIDYIDKAEAIRRYSEWAEQLVDLLDELETNPLPASFAVTLEPGPDAETNGDS